MSGSVSAKIDNGNKQITHIGIGTIAVGEGRPEQGGKNALGPIYRSQAAQTSWPTIPDVTTLFDLFERSVRKYPERRCVGWRPVRNGEAGPYTFHTYKETQRGYTLHAPSPLQQVHNLRPSGYATGFLLVAERVANVASALKAVKAGPHGALRCLSMPPTD